MEKILYQISRKLKQEEDNDEGGMWIFFMDEGNHSMCTYSMRAKDQQDAIVTFNDILYGGEDTPEKEWQALPSWIKVEITEMKEVPGEAVGRSPTFGRTYKCDIVWLPDKPAWQCLEDHDPEDSRNITFTLTPKRDGISTSDMMARFKTVMDKRPSRLSEVVTTSAWGLKSLPLAESRVREDQQLVHFLDNLKVPMDVVFYDGVVVEITPEPNPVMGDWTNIDSDNLDLLAR